MSTQNELTIKSEEKYLKKMNTLMLIVLSLHLPFAIALGIHFNTGFIFALIASLLIIVFPAFLILFTDQIKLSSITLGVAFISFSGLFIHLSQGMIEAHFHIFVAIASLIIFANPWVILAAAATAAIHHIGFYFLLPASVFNYKASFLIVIVHAFFVILETIPCIWITNKFRKFVINQGVTIEHIENLSTTMHAMISKLNKNNESLSNGADSQLSAVTQTAQTIYEINQMANQTAQNALSSTQKSNQGKVRADEGSKAAIEMSHSILRIKETNSNMLNQVQSSNQEFREIVNVIKQIENKAQIINEIVFQTKLLSFNASVEAARAGEHGKGFAVVAEEVGNLAKMSGDASKEITELIDMSVQKVENIANNTDSKIKDLVKLTLGSIEDGSDKVEICKNKLTEISSYVSEIDSNLMEITSASREQSTGINDLNKVIHDLELINQNNSNSIKISSEVSIELSKLSNELSTLVVELSKSN